MAYKETLRSLALNDEGFMESVLGMGHDTVEVCRLNPKMHALIRLGAALAYGSRSAAAATTSAWSYTTSGDATPADVRASSQKAPGLVSRSKASHLPRGEQVGVKPPPGRRVTLVPARPLARASCRFGRTA
jgi:hypothetical protein